MKNRIKSTLVVSFFAASACLWIGCSGSDDPAGAPVGGSATIKAPCDLFTLDIATGIGNGPYKDPTTDVAGSVSVCTYLGTAQSPNIHGALARFEKMSKSSFHASCSVGKKPDGTPYGGADLINDTTCVYNVLSDINHVAVSVLTASGWAVYVNSSTQAKCQVAIEVMVPKLPH